MENKKFNFFKFIILGIIIFIICIQIVLFIDNKGSFDVSNKIKNFRINGIVDTINIKPQSHNSEYIRILNFDSSIIYENIDFFDQTFIKKVSIGDTVYSESKTDSISILRNGKILKFKKAYK